MMGDSMDYDKCLHQDDSNQRVVNDDPLCRLVTEQLDHIHLDNEVMEHSDDVDEETNQGSTSIMITNVDLAVFDHPELKASFEHVLKEIEGGARFHYLRSFRRLRVDFSTREAATTAKQSLDNLLVGHNVIKCYYTNQKPRSNSLLAVPPLTKQFLISPPASPPVDWEQPREDRPVVNMELLQAMAEMGPGQQHELHSGKEVHVLGKSISTPSIIVHVANNGDDFEDYHDDYGNNTYFEDSGSSSSTSSDARSAKVKMQNTRRPDFKPIAFET